jgi:hypothetical protein
VTFAERIGIVGAVRGISAGSEIGCWSARCDEVELESGFTQRSVELMNCVRGSFVWSSQAKLKS